MERLGFLFERRWIFALAVLGAAIVVAASALMQRSSKAVQRRARALLWLGYGVTAASMLLFIVAGFLSGR